MSLDDYKLREELKKSQYDIEIGFLGRWSLLSGGTFSLLIPLLQSLGKNADLPKVFLFGEIFIIGSLISSLIGLFATKEHIREDNFIPYILYHVSFKKIKVEKKTVETLFFHIKEWASIIAMLTYIIGVVLITIFINTNLL